MFTKDWKRSTHASETVEQGALERVRAAADRRAEEDVRQLERVRQQALSVSRTTRARRRPSRTASIGIAATVMVAALGIAALGVHRAPWSTPSAAFLAERAFAAMNTPAPEGSARHLVYETDAWRREAAGDERSSYRTERWISWDGRQDHQVSYTRREAGYDEDGKSVAAPIVTETTGTTVVSPAGSVFVAEQDGRIEVGATVMSTQTAGTGSDPSHRIFPFRHWYMGRCTDCHDVDRGGAPAALRADAPDPTEISSYRAYLERLADEGIVRFDGAKRVGSVEVYVLVEEHVTVNVDDSVTHYNAVWHLRTDSFEPIYRKEWSSTTSREGAELYGNGQETRVFDEGVVTISDLPAGFFEPRIPTQRDSLWINGETGAAGSAWGRRPIWWLGGRVDADLAAAFEETETLVPSAGSELSVHAMDPLNPANAPGFPIYPLTPEDLSMAEVGYVRESRVTSDGVAPLPNGALVPGTWATNSDVVVQTIWGADEAAVREWARVKPGSSARERVVAGHRVFTRPSAQYPSLVATLVMMDDSVVVVYGVDEDRLGEVIVRLEPVP